MSARLRRLLLPFAALLLLAGPAAAAANAPLPMPYMAPAQLPFFLEKAAPPGAQVRAWFRNQEGSWFVFYGQAGGAAWTMLQVSVTPEGAAVIRVLDAGPLWGSPVTGAPPPPLHWEPRP